MARLDLDAKRAARSEAENTPHTVVLGNEEFTLPPRLPLAFLDHLTSLEFAPAMRVLLGDRWEAFAAHQPDLEDLMAIAEVYGVGDFLGATASVSPASSPAGGSPSKPTGRRTTTGTSPKTATAAARSGSAGS